MQVIPIILYLLFIHFCEGGVYAQRATAKAAMLAANVVPVVITTSTLTSDYNALFSSIGFGAYLFKF